jgi:BlaI family penicillinase repressor
MTEADPSSILDTEWDLLDVLWAAGRATAREVADALHERRGWAYSTVKTMLDRMVDKGLVHARRVGNVWEYGPAVAQAEARRGAWQRFVETAFGGATTPALQFLATGAKLTRRQREQLMRLLEEDGSDD